MRVQLSHVSKTFDRTGDVLSDISLDIPTGQFVTLLGPSGCGKSTLLRILADLEAPSAGTVALDGASPRDAEATSYVFQEPRLLPWRRAAANVALPLEITGVAEPDRSRRVAAELERVGLADFARAYPDELSGGMRMRVALARALVTEPRLLLLDEPFGALDEITRQSLNDELLRLWAKDQWSTVFVTHNMFEAVYLSQRILVMGLRPGRIVGEFSVPFEYPRRDELRGDPAFGELVAKLTAALAHAHR